MKDKSELSWRDIKKLRVLLDAHRKGGDPTFVLLDDADVQQLFGIGRRTSYTWRRKKILKAIRIRNKIFYRLSSIIEFLDSLEGKNEEEGPA